MFYIFGLFWFQRIWSLFIDKWSLRPTLQIDLDQRSASADMIDLLILFTLKIMKSSPEAWLVVVQWDLQTPPLTSGRVPLSSFHESPSDTNPAWVPVSRRRLGQNTGLPEGGMLCRLNISDRPGKAQVRSCPVLCLTVQYWWETWDLLTVINWTTMFNV